jgi:hypothetical protein
MPLRTTILGKNCDFCPDATNGKCPKTCQFSPICPKDKKLKGIQAILNNKIEEEKLFTVFEN